jgi:murein DD-endopeptidase MepM/ murein hydrolase activator NlpD
MVSSFLMVGACYHSHMEILSPIFGPIEVRNDTCGFGHFMSSRGGRLHRGLDILADRPGQPGLALSSGTVIIDNGRPSTTAPDLRYVEIRHDSGAFHWRLFYVDPLVMAGQAVTPNTVIGHLQDSPAAYGLPAMKHHFHIELLIPRAVSSSGQAMSMVRIDPRPFLVKRELNPDLDFAYNPAYDTPESDQRTLKRAFNILEKLLTGGKS